METKLENIPVIPKSTIPSRIKSQTASSCCTPKVSSEVCCTPNVNDEETNEACCEQPKDGSACCDK